MMHFGVTFFMLLVPGACWISWILILIFYKLYQIWKFSSHHFFWNVFVVLDRRVLWSLVLCSVWDWKSHRCNFKSHSFIRHSEKISGPLFCLLFLLSRQPLASLAFSFSNFTYISKQQAHAPPVPCFGYCLLLELMTSLPHTSLPLSPHVLLVQWYHHFWSEQYSELILLWLSFCLQLCHIMAYSYVFFFYTIFHFKLRVIVLSLCLHIFQSPYDSSTPNLSASSAD